MRAHCGDRLILEGTHVGDPRRIGFIVDVRGQNGSPPYLVRWFDDDHVSLVFPGPEARVEAVYKKTQRAPARLPR